VKKKESKNKGSAEKKYQKWVRDEGEKEGQAKFSWGYLMGVQGWERRGKTKDNRKSGKSPFRATDQGGGGKGRKQKGPRSVGRLSKAEVHRTEKGRSKEKLNGHRGVKLINKSWAEKQPGGGIGKDAK